MLNVFSSNSPRYTYMYMCIYVCISPTLDFPCVNHFSDSCNSCQTWPHLCVSLDKNYTKKMIEPGPL